MHLFLPLHCLDKKEWRRLRAKARPRQSGMGRGPWENAVRLIGPGRCSHDDGETMSGRSFLVQAEARVRQDACRPQDPYSKPVFSRQVDNP